MAIGEIGTLTGQIRDVGTFAQAAKNEADLAIEIGKIFP
jgi:hypothetical protein